MATITGRPYLSDTDAEEIAKSFQKAMKGLGTDEKRIIREICSLTNAQRQQVKQIYETMYGHTLEEDLKSELKGNFEDVVLALLVPKHKYDAKCLREAIKGIGTKESVVIELLCSKDGNEVQQLKAAYQEEYGSDLENDIKNEESGPLGRIFRSLASGDRPFGYSIDHELAKNEAQQLYDAGQGKHLGTDEVEFVRILCSRSYLQLRATFSEYSKIAGNDIEKAIKKETSGDLEDALLAIVKCINNEPAYFAERLYESMKGLGTKDKDLIRIIVGRSEIDLQHIKREFERMYNKKLTHELKRELSGDYEDIILAIVGSD